MTKPPVIEMMVKSGEQNISSYYENSSDVKPHEEGISTKIFLIGAGSIIAGILVVSAFLLNWGMDMISIFIIVGVQATIAITFFAILVKMLAKSGVGR